MAVRKLPRHHRWTWAVPGIIVVALLAAFFNPPDQAITQGDFDVVERVVDGDTLLLQTVSACGLSELIDLKSSTQRSP